MHLDEPVAAADEDLRWMRVALKEAALAALHGDVPVGCIVVDEAGLELGRGHNRREQDADPSGHAEIVALRAAARRVNRWRLDGATVYVSLEPCPMCAGALVNARVKRLVYATADAKAGAVHSVLQLCQHPQLNHHIQVDAGLLAAEAAAQLSQFFAELRSERRSRLLPGRRGGRLQEPE